MGEMAELLISGFMDEETGKIIDGTSPGFPRRMSEMGRQRRDDQPPLTWLRIKNESSIRQVAGWVKNRKVNTMSDLRRDRKGNWIVLLGWDDKPDSTFGKFKGYKAAIWFANRALADTALNDVRKGLGWEPVTLATAAE